jgi:Inosine-uridine preferring nucleoside hydrolase
MKRLFFALTLLAAGVAQAAERAPVPVILDTDIASDVDDVGAVAILHAMANQGEAKILAMGVCVKNPWSLLCLDALNTYFKRPEIPLGVVKGPARPDPSPYAREVAESFPHALKRAADAPDAALLYRRVLAKQPDASVVMISIGPLTNLATLLHSGPDEYSPLDGRELVKRKVREWVCMGGGFPQGREYNFICDGPATAYTVRNWPTPAVFSGHEIGGEIFTGPGMRKAPDSSPVKLAFRLYNKLTIRPSYDQTAVLYAVRGLDGGLDDVWTLKSHGRLVVNDDGGDAWHDAPVPHDTAEPKQSYLVKKMAPSQVAEMIQNLMLQPPATP